MEGTHLTHVQSFGADLSDKRARDTSGSEIRRSHDSGHHHTRDSRVDIGSARKEIFAEYCRESASSADIHFQSGQSVVRAHNQPGSRRHYWKAQARTTEMGSDACSSVRFAGRVETKGPDYGGRGPDNRFTAGRAGGFAVGTPEP